MISFRVTKTVFCVHFDVLWHRPGLIRSKRTANFKSAGELNELIKVQKPSLKCRKRGCITKGDWMEEGWSESLLQHFRTWKQFLWIKNHDFILLIDFFIYFCRKCSTLNFLRALLKKILTYLISISFIDLLITINYLNL